MFTQFRRGFFWLLCLAILFLMAPAAQASETTVYAQQIDSAQLVTETSGFAGWAPLFDGNTTAPVQVPDRTRLTLEHAEGIGSLYVLFDAAYSPCAVTDNGTGRTYLFSREGFLHDFWDLEAAFGCAPTSISVRFDSGPASIIEIFAFTSGQTPDFVQKWQAPSTSGVDMALFSTHGDDEQLFFAGLLPYYAGEMDYEVLVIYLTDHWNTNSIRRHEMLNGLWAVGVDAYPVFGHFGDFYSKSASDAYRWHARFGESKEALREFVVEQLRKYKPLVAVGHDLLQGEYGHGQHMMYAELLCYGLEAASDPDLFPGSARQWGTWDVPKTYLHLWKENPIVMNWDQPLSKFDGMTAYQVTKQLGFPQHVTQKENFWWYLKDEERSDEFQYLSPREYGLYRSTVGLDTDQQDMFENLVPYGLQAGNSSS